jgi:predicted nucleic acid-binding protein
LVVCDASCLFEFLVDGERGAAVGDLLMDAFVHMPQHGAVETANVVRRGELESVLTSERAIDALANLYALDIEYWPFFVTWERAWELRHNVTMYDAAYVALAEQLEAPLITVDARLARAPGVRCEVVIP